MRRAIRLLAWVLWPLVLWAGVQTALAATGVQGQFRSGVVDPGWELSGSAALTAPALDPVGKGVLRLTGHDAYSTGAALYSARPIRAEQGLALSFSYAAWGGGLTSGDGLAIYLYDVTQNMSGALSGGGLGFCRGAGGFLALALDAFGNFSSPQGCPGSPGTGRVPQALVIRGPADDANRLIEGAQLRDARVDDGTATVRPLLRRVRLLMRPRGVSSKGYSVDVDMALPGSGFERVMSGVHFPYIPPPAGLGVGVAATTGAARNLHEVQDVVVNELGDPGLHFQLGFSPSSVSTGGTSLLVLEVANVAHGGVMLTDPVHVRLAGGIRLVIPALLGGTCIGSVTVGPDGRSLIVGRDLALRKGRCTLSAVVSAPGTPGWFDAWVEQRSVLTDHGVNSTDVRATLATRR